MLLVPVWYREVMVERKAFQLRLPIGLHAELVGAARAARRSLNSEIVWRLEALDGAGGGTVPAGSSPGPSEVAPQPAPPSASGLSSEPFEEAP